MRATADPIDTATHRLIAVRLFNRVWEFMEKADRTSEEDDEMLHAAHASRYHWGHVREPATLARGEWQVSRVYAVLGRGEPALHHARRSLELCKQDGLEDFDLAFAYEALARASAISGDRASRDRWVAKAREASAQIAESDDRRHFDDELATVPA